MCGQAVVWFSHLQAGSRALGLRTWVVEASDRIDYATLVRRLTKTGE